MAFSVKNITIKQGKKGEYKVLQGAIQTPEYNDPGLYNINVCIFKDDPDYTTVHEGQVLQRNVVKNGEFWNLEKATQVIPVKKDVNIEAQLNSIWTALNKIGEHLEIEWFKKQANNPLYDGIEENSENLSIPF